MKLFYKKQKELNPIMGQIEEMLSDATYFQESYEARKKLYELGFTTNFVQRIYDDGYEQHDSFDTYINKNKWIYKNIKTIFDIGKESEIYKLIKITYLGGCDNWLINQKFSHIAKDIQLKNENKKIN